MLCIKYNGLQVKRLSVDIPSLDTQLILTSTTQKSKFAAGLILSEENEKQINQQKPLGRNSESFMDKMDKVFQT